MDSLELNLLKKSNITKNYIKLIQNLNVKIDEKIEDVTNKIVDEFEKKKKELLELKNQLDEYNKIKNEISNLNNFYQLAQTKNKNLIINTVTNNNYDNNPYKTSNNILSQVSNVNISITNGDLIKKCFKTNNIETINANELKNSDTILSSFSRLLIKKANTIKTMDSNKVLLESNKTNIILDFGDVRVCPSDVIVRYFFLPNENKYTFSYINHILASNDGDSWEIISNVNLNEIRMFEKVPMFKYNLMNNGKEIETYYRYISLEISGTKDIAHTNQINRYFNKYHIPLCGIEVYGQYYSDSDSKHLDNLDEEFEQFFELYINKNYLELSEKSEAKFFVKMLSETYKELNSLVISYKSKIEVENIVKNIFKNTNTEITEVGNSNSEDSKRIYNQFKKELNELNSITESIESQIKEEVVQLTENKMIKNILDGIETKSEETIPSAIEENRNIYSPPPINTNTFTINTTTNKRGKRKN